MTNDARRTPGRRRGFAVIALGVLATMAAPDAAAQRAGQLTAGARIARAYDAIFDARFADVAPLLEDTCTGPSPAARMRSAGPAAHAAADSGRVPGEVCQLLALQALWWQMQLDPDDTSFDAVFVARADEAIAAVSAWTVREPQRAEAWFYLGGAYGARAQWRVLRGERLAAARDGKRIKEALERSLELDRGLQDAYFGIGLYRYYADVVPTAAKMLRWLLALPGGNREQGLADMVRAREGGQILRSEADYQLHLIYLWYERQPQRALDLLRRLRTAHPHNPRFLQLIAEVEDVYFQDHAAALRSWQTLFESARAGTVAAPAMSAARARLGMALALDRLYETDRAIGHLRALLESPPPAPVGIVARARLQLGQALDRVGDRDEAIANYRAALAALPEDDPHGVREPARAGLRRRPDPNDALAYRLSIEGWRALERGALAEAGRALSKAGALQPDDPVTWYRTARVREAEGDDVPAIELLERVIGAGGATPPTFYAAACFDAARLYERQQALPRALELYQRARDAEDADERTRTAAARALARLAIETRTSR